MKGFETLGLIIPPGSFVATRILRETLAGAEVKASAGNADGQRVKSEDLTRKKNVTALVAYGSSISGGERVTLDIAAALKSRGDTLIGVVPSPGPMASALEDLGAQIEVLDLKKTYDLRSSRKLAQVLNRHRVSVVQTHGYLRNVHGRLARRFFGGPPHVGVTHRALSWKDRWKDLSGKERLRARYYQWIERLTADASFKTVAVSGAVRQDLLDAGVRAESIQVIPNGIVDTPTLLSEDQQKELRKTLGIPSQGLLLFTAARLSPLKDVATMVRALAEPAAKDWYLAVAGEGPELKALIELVEELSLKDRVRLLGRREDVPALLGIANCFGLSSLAGEGLPIALLEAMRQSLPAVVTHEPGTLEAAISEKTALVVPAGSPHAFGEALGRLSQDQELMERLGRQGRVRYETCFGVDRMTQAHLKLLDAARFEPAL